LASSSCDHPFFFLSSVILSAKIIFFSFCRFYELNITVLLFAFHHSGL
jgi:hypothetical protein